MYTIGFIQAGINSLSRVSKDRIKRSRELKSRKLRKSFIAILNHRLKHGVYFSDFMAWIFY